MLLNKPRTKPAPPSALHTKIPTLKNRGWGTPVTLLPDKLQKWYSLFACRPQEKRKSSTSGPPVQMLKSLRNAVLSLLTWYAVAACSILFMYAIAHRKSPGPEGVAYLTWAFLLGLLVVLPSSPFCRLLNRVPSTLVGMGFGLLIPIIFAWLWGRSIEQWALSRGLLWTGLDAWIAGMQLAIPSSIGGSVSGYLQGRVTPTAGGTHDKF